MRRAVIALSFLLAAALCQTNEEVPPEELLEVTAETIDEALGLKAFNLVFFRRPQCPICDTLETELRHAAAVLNEEGILIVRVNAGRSNELALKHGVSGFPTMKLFHGATEILRPYRGGYTAEEIVHYLREQSQPPSTLIESIEDARHFVPSANGDVSSHEPKIVIFAFFNNVGQDLQTLQRAEDDIRDTGHYRFLHSAADDVSQFYGKRSTFAIYRPGASSDTPVPTWPVGEPLEHHRVLDFIAKHGLPFVGELNEGSMALYSRSTKPVFRLYLDQRSIKQMLSYYERRLREIATRVPGIAFSWVDLEATGEGILKRDYRDLGYGEHDTSAGVAFGIFSMSNMYRPQVPQDRFDVDAVSKYCEEFLANPELPFLKSQPLPAEQTTDVLTIVGSTFRQNVYNESQAVFVLLHAPWCGYCKQMIPAWVHLASEVRRVGHVAMGLPVPTVIAMMDATENAVPPGYSVSGYPTMYLAVPGRKSHPILYTGPRSLEHFVDFLREAVAR